MAKAKSLSWVFGCLGVLILSTGFGALAEEGIAQPGWRDWVKSSQALRINEDLTVSVGRGPDELSGWCDTVRLILDAAKRRANDAQVRDPDTAVLELIQGLERANQSSRESRINGLFTVRAIQRGLVLATEVGGAVHEARNATTTMLHFLYAYYDFIRHVSDRIDLSYRIPSLDCQRCPERALGGNVGFEMAFVRYGKETVETILRSMARRVLTPIDGGDFRGRDVPLVTPAGSPRGFLKALSLSSRFAASDLRESLDATRYACVIQRLEELSNEIDSSGHEDGIAVNRAYFSAQSIIAPVQGSPCLTVPHWGYEYPKKDLLQASGISRIDVNRSQPQYSILVPVDSFGTKSYVEYLDVAAHGVRGDATFEVWADGVRKGTVHVPWRDPWYVVTIRDHVRVITLKHTQGATARVTSVWGAMPSR